MENNNGTPCNTRSLLAFTFGLMTKLQNGEIGAQQVNAQAKLINCACNIYKVELGRSAVQIQRAMIQNENLRNEVEVRQIESKKFDDELK